MLAVGDRVLRRPRDLRLEQLLQCFEHGDEPTAEARDQGTSSTDDYRPAPPAGGNVTPSVREMSNFLTAEDFLNIPFRT